MFHGSGETMLMDPPHVIISSNYLFDSDNNLSKDRWKVYEIKNKDLGKVNELIKKEKLKKQSVG